MHQIEKFDTALEEFDALFEEHCNKAFGQDSGHNDVMAEASVPFGEFESAHQEPQLTTYERHEKYENHGSDGSYQTAEVSTRFTTITGS